MCRGADGTISLQELHEQLSRSGLHEMARAVESLAARLSSSLMIGDPTIVPWF
jgi:hypothetical protein